MSRPVIDLNGPKGRIVDAALALATERPWRAVSLRDIAERAGMDLVGMRAHFASKADVMSAFVRAVDDAVLASLDGLVHEDPKRDQLFEIVMARFDALAPYKTALRSISADLSADPALIRAHIASQAWMLEAAGIGADGIEGGMRVAGLAAVYASVYRTWLADDDPGQARTMAALDRRLRRGERTLQTLDGVAAGVRGLADRLGGLMGSAGGRASAGMNSPSGAAGAGGDPEQGADGSTRAV